MATILIVGVHPWSRHVISTMLDRAGYGVDVTPEPEVLKAVPDTVDAVVIDLTPPADWAIAALEDFAVSTAIPAVAFSGTADLSCAIEALDLGAEDLLTAFCTIEELTARMRAILRRHRREPDRSPTVLTTGPLSLDVQRRMVTVRGRDVELTSLESKLLLFFLLHPYEAVSRKALLEEVWGYTVGATATVTVHVRRLREKVEKDPGQPTLIRTVWGLGYRFCPIHE